HPMRSAWALVSHDIFYLNPFLGHTFPSKLVDTCLETATDLVFGLSHSDAISCLVKHNASEINFPKCKAVLEIHHDSRGLYALKALRWYPVWDDIRSLVLRSLLSPKPAIRTQAYWLLRERANWRELKNFLDNDTLGAELRGNR